MPAMLFGLMFDNITLNLPTVIIVANMTANITNSTNSTQTITQNNSLIPSNNSIINSSSINLTPSSPNNTNTTVNTSINSSNNTINSSNNTINSGTQLSYNTSLPSIDIITIYIDFQVKINSSFVVLTSNFSMSVFWRVTMQFVQNWRVFVENYEISFDCSKN